MRVSFVPHLLPTVRGIATSVYVRPRPGATAAAARAALERAYAAEPFVRVLPEGELPSLRSVRGSNFCDVAFVEDARNDTWILLSTLDNLVQGRVGSGGAVREPDVRLRRRGGPARRAVGPEALSRAHARRAAPPRAMNGGLAPRCLTLR